MRRVWAVLVCLCLLWSGSVAPVLASVPCDMAMADRAGDVGDTIVADCCLDADPSDAGAPGCQPGGACAVAGIALLATEHPAWSLTSPMPGAPWPAMGAGAPAAAPGAVWRPPTARG